MLDLPNGLQALRTLKRSAKEIEAEIKFLEAELNKRCEELEKFVKAFNDGRGKLVQIANILAMTSPGVCTLEQILATLEIPPELVLSDKPPGRLSLVDEKIAAKAPIAA